MNVTDILYTLAAQKEHAAQKNAGTAVRRLFIFRLCNRDARQGVLATAAIFGKIICLEKTF